MIWDFCYITITSDKTRQSINFSFTTLPNGLRVATLPAYGKFCTVGGNYYLLLLNLSIHGLLFSGNFSWFKR